MGLHTSRHTRKNSSFSTQDEHLVLLGLEALICSPQPPLRDTLYLREMETIVAHDHLFQFKTIQNGTVLVEETTNATARCLALYEIQMFKAMVQRCMPTLTS